MDFFLVLKKHPEKYPEKFISSGKLLPPFNLSVVVCDSITHRTMQPLNDSQQFNSALCCVQHSLPERNTWF